MLRQRGRTNNFRSMKAGITLIDMLIRDEEAADITAIREVVETAFRQQLEARLVDQLRADGDGVISLVAVDDGKVVGHVLFSRMTAPFRALGLAPVSVAPDRQRSGVGSQLIRAGLERAADRGWNAVFVLGDPEFYQRFGFSVTGASGFTSPYAGPYLMVLALNGELPAKTGKIDYAPAFAAFE
jgi:putative acetyltransferase